VYVQLNGCWNACCFRLDKFMFASGCFTCVRSFAWRLTNSRSNDDGKHSQRIFRGCLWHWYCVVPYNLYVMIAGRIKYRASLLLFVNGRYDRQRHVWNTRFRKTNSCVMLCGSSLSHASCYCVLAMQTVSILCSSYAIWFTKINALWNLRLCIWT